VALRDTLLIYDMAVTAWVAAFSVLRGSSNPQFTAPRVQFATPDRPYGSYDNLEQLQDQLQLAPVVTVQRSDETYDPRHRTMDANGILIGQTGDGQYVYSQNPRPYRLSYQVDLRTRLRSYANIWQQTLYFSVNQYHQFNINFGIPWGLKTILGTFEGKVVDNSDLESEEKSGYKRLTFTMSLTAFLFPSVDDIIADIPNSLGTLWLTGFIKQIVMNFVDSSLLTPSDPSNVALDTIQINSSEFSFSLPIETVSGG
jgi:hypothetical protein